MSKWQNGEMATRSKKITTRLLGQDFYDKIVSTIFLGQDCYDNIVLQRTWLQFSVISNVVRTSNPPLTRFDTMYSTFSEFRHESALNGGGLPRKQITTSTNGT